MLRRMYSEKPNEVRNLRSRGSTLRVWAKRNWTSNFIGALCLTISGQSFFFTALLTTMAVLYSLLATPIYAAKATLLLESQKANIISIEDLVYSEQESNSYYGTQYAVLKSRALAERVLAELAQSDTLSQSQLAKILAHPSLNDSTVSDGDEESLNAPIDEDSDAAVSMTASLAERLSNAQYNKAINQFRESLSISPVVKTKLVTIKYESSDPEYSAIVANAVANQYIENSIEQRKFRTDEASAWMDSRIQELKIKLDESEGALLSFKRANGLIDLDGDVGRLSDQQLLFMSSELAKAKGELSNARDLYLKTQTIKTSSPNLLETLPYVQNDVTVRSANC